MTESFHRFQVRGEFFSPCEEEVEEEEEERTPLSARLIVRRATYGSLV